MVFLTGHSYQMVDHKGAGMDARFYINGERVSRDTYETLETLAYSGGRLDCFDTKGTSIAGGKTRRTNYKTATL